MLHPPVGLLHAVLELDPRLPPEHPAGLAVVGTAPPVALWAAGIELDGDVFAGNLDDGLGNFADGGAASGPS